MLTLPELMSNIEAILIVVGEAIPTEDMADALSETPERIQEALGALGEEYGRGRVNGFELKETAGGWRLYSRAEHFETVKQFLTRGQTAKLSQAALETLAVVAYAGPVTRGRIAAIRGVNVDGVVRTLVMRGLIVEASGTEGPTQYVTSTVFLESLGLASLEELPDIAPYLPDDIPAEPGIERMEP